MNRKNYLENVKSRLSDLPQEEIDAALEYIVEYCDEAENDEIALEQLGSAIQFANQTRNDYYARNNIPQMSRKHSTTKSILFVVFAILSLPITLPLLIVALALMLVVIILMCIPFFVFFILLFVFIAVGFALLWTAFTLPGITVVESLFLIANVCVLFGLTGLTMGGLIAFVGKFIPWVIRSIQHMFSKRGGAQYE